MTCYELWKGKKPSVKYFRVLRRSCYVSKSHKNLGKIKSKSKERIFLEYSSKSQACKVYFEFKCMVESFNVIVDDQGLSSIKFDDDRIEVSKDVQLIKEKSEDERLSEEKEKG